MASRRTPDRAGRAGMRVAAVGAGRVAVLVAALGAVRCAGAAPAGIAGRDAGSPVDPEAADGSAAQGAPPASPADASPSASSTGSPTADATLPCSAFPLCDGFEDAPVGGPPSAALWSIAQPDCTGTGTLAVDDTQAHSGTRSVRVDGGGGYCDHVFIANAAVMPSLGSDVYARVFVRLGAPLGAGHVTFLAMKDDADNGDDVRMGGQDAILMYNRQSDDGTLPTLSPTGVGLSVALAVNAWSCVEFHVDEAAGTIDTWVNGAEVAGLVENGTPVADVSTQWLSRANWRPKLADLRLGWESYSGQAMTLWFDDVALSTKRIGCDG